MSNRDEFRKLLEEDEALKNAGLKDSADVPDAPEEEEGDLYWREADREAAKEQYDEYEEERKSPRKKYNDMRVRAEEPAEEEEVPTGLSERLRFFRKKTEEAKKEHSGAAYLSRERERKIEKLRDVFVIAALVATLLPLLLLFLHNYRFTTYSVDYELALGASGCLGLHEFKGGNVILENDKVVYVKNADVAWTVAISMDHPVFRKRGDYFAVADRGGYRFGIFDDSGLQGIVNVSRKIRTFDLSASGVVAVSTESDSSSFVSYFNRYGNRIDVEVKTLLDASGYPMSLSVSPDGQRLLVVYYRVQNGIGESCIAVYDFSSGKKERNYLIAEYRDYYNSGTYLADCRFIDDRHAIVVGDREIVFLSDFLRGNVVRQNKPVSGELKSVLFTETGLFTVITEGTKTETVIYDAAGRETSRFSCPDAYDTILVNEKYVCFFTDTTLRFYNVSGICRYEGELPHKPQHAAFSEDRSIVMNTGSKFQKITLK